jgi:hypothetical protein
VLCYFKPGFEETWKKLEYVQNFNVKPQRKKLLAA